MKKSTLTSEAISGTGEEGDIRLQDSLRLEAVSWLRRLFNEVRASFDTLFESDWEKKAGRPWREWGKYGDKGVSAPIKDFISSLFHR
jgi:hypothetical protein